MSGITIINVNKTRINIRNPITYSDKINRIVVLTSRNKINVDRRYFSLDKYTKDLSELEYEQPLTFEERGLL